jgi:hypothetical protein
MSQPGWSSGAVRFTPHGLPTPQPVQSIQRPSRANRVDSIGGAIAMIVVANVMFFAAIFLVASIILAPAGIVLLVVGTKIAYQKTRYLLTRW